MRVSDTINELSTSFDMEATSLIGSLFPAWHRWRGWATHSWITPTDTAKQYYWRVDFPTKSWVIQGLLQEVTKLVLVKQLHLSPWRMNRTFHSYSWSFFF